MRGGRGAGPGEERPLRPLPFEPDLATARRFLDRHGPARSLLVGVTGAHFYGFPSRDSDLDLKGIHIAPTAQMVGLYPPSNTVDVQDAFDRALFDFTSHELGFALQLLLRGNGNMLERILTPYQVIDSEDARRLRELTHGAVSRRFFSHYRGFFGRKRRELEAPEPPTAKGLLYCYRAALTGIHLLRTGECVGDVLTLADQYGLPDVGALVEEKQRGAEHGEARDPGRHLATFDRLDAMLSEAHASSPLPSEPANLDAVSRFLIETRRKYFDGEL